MIWYHGTTTAGGMASGDWIDPSRGGFENGVWATSSLPIARQWANAAQAVVGDGEPAVFEIEIDEDDAARVDQDEDEAPDADVVIVARGEGLVPTAFIRGSRAARVGRRLSDAEIEASRKETSMAQARKLEEARAAKRAELERLRGRILWVLGLVEEIRESHLWIAMSVTGRSADGPEASEALRTLLEEGMIREGEPARLRKLGLPGKLPPRDLAGYAADRVLRLPVADRAVDFAAHRWGFAGRIDGALGLWLTAYRPTPTEQRRIAAWLAEIARTSAPIPRSAEEIERLSQHLRDPDLQMRIRESFTGIQPEQFAAVRGQDPASPEAQDRKRWRDLAVLWKKRADAPGYEGAKITPKIDRARVEAVIAWRDRWDRSSELSPKESEILEGAAILRAADLLVATVRGQRGREAQEIRARRREAAAVDRDRRKGHKIRPALRQALAELATMAAGEISKRFPAAANLRPPPTTEPIPCCPRSGCRSVAASRRAAAAIARLDRAREEALKAEAAARQADAAIAVRREALTREQARLAATTPPTEAAAKRRDRAIAALDRQIGELDTCPQRRRRRLKAGPVVLGSWPDLITPSGAVPVIATVISADQLVTSHLPRSWAIDPRYPAATQERRYDRDPVEQMKVTLIARALQPALLLARTPSALDGPPVVIAEGGDYLALGGNGRGMALRMAYSDGSADGYEAALRQLVRRPLPPRPVLVRVLRPESAEPGSWARWSRELNRPLGAGLDLTAQGVSLARSLPARVVSILAGRDLAAALRGAPGREAIRELQIAGLVGQGERGLFEDEGLSEQGRALVRRALAGAVLQDADLVDALPAAVVDQIARGAASILEAAAVGGPTYDLRRAVQAAARDYADARSWRAGIESWIASPHLVPPAVLGEALGPPTIRALVDGRLPELAAAWLDVARAHPEGQAILFADPRSPPEILASLVTP